MKFRKTIILVQILILSIILTSCVGSREVNELGIVTTTGVDIEDEEIIVTHEVIIPQSNTSTSGTSDSSVIYIQSKGETVFDALRNATLSFDRKLFMAHNRIVILGDEFARRGIGGYFNFFINDNEPRESAYLLVAKDTKAYEVMGINGGLSDTPGKYLNDLMENYKFNSKTRSLSINNVLKYSLRNYNPVIAIVESIQQLEIDKEEDKSIKNALNVEGGAVFHIDKLVGFYNGDEMQGFNFLVDEFENGLIVFDTPDEIIRNNEFIANRGKYSVFEVKNSNTKKEVELIDEKLHLLIDVNIKGALMEDTKGLDIIKKDIYYQVELACSNKVRELIETTMNKAQKVYKIDTFSISNLVHIKYPDLWREIKDDWDSIFPEISYTINVKTDMIRAGLMNTPTNIRKEKK
ncbi:MAG: Ger(x)C family spore germination protein [Tissierellaceae bacterium]|nr:Ger(x)C family spore germination protein [Tissierellaceae bacterium]